MKTTDKKKALNLTGRSSVCNTNIDTFINLKSKNQKRISDYAIFVLDESDVNLKKKGNEFLEWCKDKDVMPVYKTYRAYLLIVDAPPFTYGDPNAQKNIDKYLNETRLIDCFQEPKQ
jgi:hypothetical protein